MFSSFLCYSPSEDALKKPEPYKRLLLGLQFLLEVFRHVFTFPFLMDLSGIRQLSLRCLLPDGSSLEKNPSNQGSTVKCGK